MASPDVSEEDKKALEEIKMMLNGRDALDVERDLAAGVVRKSTLDKIEKLPRSGVENDSHGSKGRFDLMLGDLLVGVLLYEDGAWSFTYSDEYKAQDKLEPLVNFPNLDQVYKSDQLWPFFASRLPGVTELKEKERESMDVLSLLKKYGRHVITNPYKLVAL